MTHAILSHAILSILCWLLLIKLQKRNLQFSFTLLIVSLSQSEALKSLFFLFLLLLLHMLYLAVTWAASQNIYILVIKKVVEQKTGSQTAAVSIFMGLHALCVQKVRDFDQPTW